MNDNRGTPVDNRPAFHAILSSPLHHWLLISSYYKTLRSSLPFTITRQVKGMQVTTTHVPALVEVCFAISGLTDPDLHPAIINTPQPPCLELVRLQMKEVERLEEEGALYGD